MLRFLRPSEQLKSRRSVFSRDSIGVLEIAPENAPEQHPPAATTDLLIGKAQQLSGSALQSASLHTQQQAAAAKNPPRQPFSSSFQTTTSFGEEGAAATATCDYGTVQDIQSLIQEGLDINATAEDGNTPLAVAAFHGDLAVAEFLVENGADTNLSTVQGAPPLYWAARNGHTNIIDLLCRKGADPNKEARDGLTPLACAALDGHADVVQVLLQHGAWPDSAHKDTQETPLYWAAHEGHFKCCQILLQHGADCEMANRVGETPLFWASRNGHKHCVKCLLTDGKADPNASTWDKQTAIFWASMNQHEDCVQLLLQYDADPNIVTKTVNRCITTPLEAALHNSNTTCVKLLHEYGATEDFSVHKGWHDTVDPEFMSFLLELDWAWESKQALLESAIRNIKDDEVLLKIVHARLEDVNRESSDRRTIFLLMLELYLYVLWIDCFATVAFKDLQDSQALTNYGGPSTMLGLTAFFFVKEFLAAQQQGRRYFLDPWNWVDMAAISLVTTAMSKYIRGHTILGGEGDVFKNIVISAGALVCLSFVGYLKATFLPFSNFVGGVTRICWDLLPFGLVTAIILFVFSFMYYVNEFETSDEFESFYQSFLTVFSYFVGDPRRAEGPLDIIFGVLLIIVLLNVVIAIVSASWENAVNTSLILLVTHRFQLLRRANDSSTILPKWFKGEWFIDKKFDDMLDSWVAKMREEYEFWIGTNRCHPACFLYALFYTTASIIRPIITVFMWILGLITFGLLWPAYVRKNLFGIKPEKASVAFRIGQVEEQTTKMAANTERMYGELKRMNSKIDNNKNDNSNNNASPTSAKDTPLELQQVHLKLDRVQQQLDRLDGYNNNNNRNNNSYSSINEDVGDRLTLLEYQVRQMDDDMKTLHTKVDLVLEYLVNAANANQAGRPGLPDSTESLRPNQFRSGS